MRLTALADWQRPSTWMLLAVVSANLAAPLLYLQSAGADDAEVRDVPPVQPRVAVTPRVEPVSPAVTRPVSPAVTRPVSPNVPARRVAVHQSAPVCRAWGPFEEVTEAESLALRLQLERRAFEVFESRIEAEPDYLVTLRVPGPRRAADRIIQELAGQNLESYLLERGPDGSVLALGVFSAERRAKAQRQRALELGYEAVVRPLERARSVYHLLARLPAGREPEITPAGACGDIAPMNQFL